jgi:hypothetical protein
VQREIVDARPLGVRLTPDKDLPIIGGAGEDVSVFRVRPGDGPDCAFVSIGFGG